MILDSFPKSQSNKGPSESKIELKKLTYGQITNYTMMTVTGYHYCHECFRLFLQRSV